jgi:FkbM family methyltransferase
MRKQIRKLFQQFGYDIVRYKPAFVRNQAEGIGFGEDLEWLKDFAFKSIIDIGANEGQFSDKMRRLFPSATIHAFEPLPGVFARLNNNFAQDAQFISYNTGLGEQPGHLEFWENDYSPSSSFLDLANSHKQHFEDATESKKVSVTVDRLDNIFLNKKLDSPLLIKIDVQGFEDKVIRGGTNTLRQADMIICELSFIELYKGQPLFHDIYESLKLLGFNYAGSIEQLRSPGKNQILQADGIFIKQQ